MCYGALSTFACASIASGFFKHGIRQGPMVPWRGSKISMMALPLQGVALFILSQKVPELSVSRMMGGGCPFSFPPKTDEIKGVRRITRHPDLMAMGLFGLGSACATIRMTEFFFGLFPFIFSLVGAAH